MHSDFFLQYANAAIQTLKAYDPGLDIVALRAACNQQVLAELGSNEHADGPSPKAIAAVQAHLNELRRYPDPRGYALKQRIAARHHVALESILLGNGSHELLMQFAQVFAGQADDVLMSQYGFAVYAIAAQSVGARCVQAPAFAADHPEQPLGHNLDAIAECISAKTRLIYLANPNNPTGTYFSAQTFSDWMAKIPAHVLVIVDEAYAELATAVEYESAISWLAHYPNLVITRTFSKGYGLAGLRVGYALGHPDVIRIMERVRESFNVNLLGLAAAEAAIDDQDYLQQTRQRNQIRLQHVRSALKQQGWRVFPSQTNFVLVDFGRHADAIEQHLLQHSIAPRPMAGYGLPNCLRITIGNEMENQRLIHALSELQHD